MGTPDFAAHSLKAILASDHQVLAVVTAPDRPAGRGRKLKASAVKEVALKADVPVLQPTNLKSPDFIATLQELQPEVAIVVAFRMLPKVVWSIPAKGTINLHASLLPQYRGAAPINWVLINGESKTGVTTFFINENIDTGAILLQASVAIEAQETAGSLHDKLMETGSELLLKTILQLEENRLQAQPQKDNDQLKLAPKIYKQDQKLHFNQSAQQVLNRIRGLSPYPAAYAELVSPQETLTFKIYQASIIEEKPQESPGQLKTDGKKYLHVACADGYLSLKEVQLAGKKRMPIQALLNGFPLSPAIYLR